VPNFALEPPLKGGSSLLGRGKPSPNAQGGRMNRTVLAVFPQKIEYLYFKLFKIVVGKIVRWLRQ